MKRAIIAIVMGVGVLSFSLTSAAQDGWTLDGGAPWKNRVGPGLQLAIGGNSCTDEFCDSSMDVKFFGFGGTLEFFYRLIPNVVVFVDIHNGLVNTNYSGAIENDRGYMFTATVGGEFHVPFTGWLDAYLGLGLGYALLRFTGDYAGTQNTWSEMSLSYRGTDIDLKLGVDVYPISGAPTFGVGLLFRWGFTIWARACEKTDLDSDFQCDDPDTFNSITLSSDDDVAQEPFLVFFGVSARYGF